MDSKPLAQFNAYSMSNLPDPDVAAFFAGRCLARLKWHLQQSWLLAPGARWAIAERVFYSIALLPHAWNSNTRLEVSILKICRDLKAEYFSEDRSDAIYAALNECNSTQPERVFDDELQFQVNHINQVIVHVESLVTNSLPNGFQALEQLGRCIEEGICRPDVEKWLHETGRWPELVMSKKLQDLHKELFEEVTEVNIGQPGPSTPDWPSTFASIARKPADLAPEGVWFSRLPVYWQKAVMPVLPDAFFEVEKLYQRQDRESLHVKLVRLVNELGSLVVWKLSNRGNNVVPAAVDSAELKNHDLIAEPVDGNSSKPPMARVLHFYSGGVSDERFKKVEGVLQDDDLTTGEKLTKIDQLIPIPSTNSAEKIAEMLGVTKQMVLKTNWWASHRKGEKGNEIGRRLDVQRERANSFKPEPPTLPDD